ncbi:MAG: S41 family peptidase, partial [Chloroflexi bacterium]|nr:S41 family peptidase [Chloroflexota bacterium]
MRKRLFVLLTIALASALLASACGLPALGSSRRSQSPPATATPVQGAKAAPSTTIEANVNLLRETLEILAADHVDRQNLNLQKLRDGGIRGVIQALNDPHSAYIDAESYRVGRNDLSGSFDGIGAQVALREGEITIVSPIPGSPAERAGLRTGDVILDVNGAAVKGKSLLEVVALIRGPRGSEVTLTITRPGSQPQKFTIVRDIINLDSVAWRMATEDVAHIRIGYFSQRTTRELEEALRQARSRGVKGIVLDMRGNPGGLLDASVRVASQFLRSGVVVYEVQNDGTERPWGVLSGGIATTTPLAVLVDEGSASGAEVVAGALQDARRAPLIGTKTFGKGSINIVRELSNGGALYVTSGRWLTPARHQIEGKG